MLSTTSLSGLAVRVWSEPAEDVAVIFADPTLRDLNAVISDVNLLKLVQALLRVAEKQKSTPTSPWEDYSWDIDKEDNEGGHGLDVKVEVSVAPLANLQQGVEDAQLTDAADNVEAVGHLGTKAAEKAVNVPADKRHIIKMSASLFGCPVCAREFNCRSNAYKHLRTHGIGVEPVEDRTCPHCAKIFHHAKGCKRHAETCSARSAPLHCHACDVKCASVEALKGHKKTAHPDSRLKCSFCDYTAPRPGYRLIHEKKVHMDLFCRVCSRLFKDAAEKGEHECVAADRWQCNQCPKSYKFKSELAAHREAIHQGRRFPCSLCPNNTELSSVQALKRHMRLVHEPRAKSWRCSLCGKAFKDRQTLRGHERTHDSSQRSDPCPECGKVLSSQSALREHVKSVHEKASFRHVCEDCGQRFAQLHRLNIHAEMAHNKGAKLVCQVCGKEMIGKHRLQNHLLSHPEGQKSVQCEHCGKDVLETQLKSHVVEAHKMADYHFQCTYCPKRCDTKTHMRSHIRKHTGARPFSCLGCGNQYRDRQPTLIHIKTAHQGDLSLCSYDITKDIDNPFVN